MSVFAVIPLHKDKEPLKKAVFSSFKSGEYHTLKADAGYLVDFDGTTIELCKKLGIAWPQNEKGPQEPAGPALVIPFTYYYGRGSADMWEWLKNKIEL